MKKGDLTTKAIGLAIAGVLAGSGLAMALPSGEAKEAKSAGDEKAKDKKQASSDKHVCKGMNACKGKGGCKSGDAGCAGKNSCKGKGGCASAELKHACKGMNACKGQGGCKSGDAGCARQELLQGQGRLRGSREAGGVDPHFMIGWPPRARQDSRRSRVPSPACQSVKPVSRNRWGFPDLGRRRRPAHASTTLTSSRSGRRSTSSRSSPRTTWTRAAGPLRVLEQVAERYPVVAARRLAVDRQHRPARPRVPPQAESSGRRARAPAGSPTTSAGRACRPQHARPAPDALHRGGPAPRRRACADRVGHPRAAADARERLHLRRVRRVDDAGVGVLRPPGMEQADCGMLLDVNNVYVSAFNHGFDPQRLPRRDRPADAWCSTTWPDTPTRARTSSTRTTTTRSTGGLGAVPARPSRAPATSRRCSSGTTTSPRSRSCTPRRSRRARSAATPREPVAARRLLSLTLPSPAALDAGRHRASGQRCTRPWIAARPAPSWIPPTSSASSCPRARSTSVERVGIYQGMYLLRMVEALETDYPAVAHFLGADGFADLVTRYVQAHPVRQLHAQPPGRPVSRVRARVPGHAAPGVRRRPGAAGAPGHRGVRRSGVAGAGPRKRSRASRREAWAAARLEPIAAFRLGAFGYPVNAYLQSVKEENHDHPGTARQPTWTAVWRKNYEVWRLNLSKPQHDFLKALAKGRPFGKAVAEAARGLQGAAGDQLFRWLRDWVAEGMFTRLERALVASPDPFYNPGRAAEAPRAPAFDCRRPARAGLRRARAARPRIALGAGRGRECPGPFRGLPRGRVHHADDDPGPSLPQGSAGSGEVRPGVRVPPALRPRRARGAPRDGGRAGAAR